MSSEEKKITLGQAIDAIVQALEALPDDARTIAVSAACESLQIKVGQAAHVPVAIQVPPAPANLSGSPGFPPGAAIGAIVDIRTLRQTKQPSSTAEMAALVAFYLQAHSPEADRKDAIGTEDLDKYFKLAEYPLPKRMDNVLPASKAAGYFDSAERGLYKLNPIGYNLVAHTLPRKSSAKKA